jgi:methionyl-tRNA formyltransferase
VPLRIVFFGTAELARASLRALAQCADYQVITVVTQPDKPRGRDMQMQFTPVKALAVELDVPVLQPKRAREEPFIEQIRSLAPDLNVVVAYGQILPEALLNTAKFGSLNVHTSLLPRHRGAAPIQWAILEGDSETGVTIMKMDSGLDTGPILNQERTPVFSEDNSQTLHDRLAAIGAKLLLKTIPHYVEGSLQPVSQPEGATYAKKIEKADGQMDWSLPAVVNWRRIRAFTPWPGAFSFLETEGKRRMVKLFDATVSEDKGAPGTILKADRAGLVIACGENSLKFGSVQPEGRKRMLVSEFLAGNPISPGQVFAR